jgi:hypothetical protein
MGVEEPIDFDRVISDRSYRRDVIKYLNRCVAGGSEDAEACPGGGIDSGVNATTRARDGDSLTVRHES